MPIFTAEERVGRTLGGRYGLQSILARGGMGIIYDGIDRFADRPVAVKLLKSELLLGDPTGTRRFLREVRAAAELCHPNLVDVLDTGTDDDGATYLVLERLEGEGLERRLARGPMPLAETVRLLLPVMDALECVHARGIIHRDIKPDNIYLHRDPDGRVVPKLLDFGIAKVAEAGTKQTATGFVLGTPEYMSPEQAKGAPDLGPAADVWALAVVFYECLTGGFLPFPAESGPEVLLRILTEGPVPMADLPGDVPREVARVVEGALDPDLARRSTTVAAFRSALLEACDAAGVELDADEGAEPYASTLPPPPRISWVSPTTDRRLRTVRGDEITARTSPGALVEDAVLVPGSASTAPTAPPGPPARRGGLWWSGLTLAATVSLLVAFFFAAPQPRGDGVVAPPPAPVASPPFEAPAPTLPDGRETPEPEFVRVEADPEPAPLARPPTTTPRPPREDADDAPGDDVKRGTNGALILSPL